MWSTDQLDLHSDVHVEKQARGISALLRPRESWRRHHQRRESPPILWKGYLDVAGTKAGGRPRSCSPREDQPPPRRPRRPATSSFVLRGGLAAPSSWERTCMLDRPAWSVRSPLTRSPRNTPRVHGRNMLALRATCPGGEASQEEFLGRGPVTGPLAKHISRPGDASPIAAYRRRMIPVVDPSCIAFAPSEPPLLSAGLHRI